MNCLVSINGNQQHFTDVEGFSFFTGRDNNTGKAVAQWTKYMDDNPSEEWVNLDPSKLTIRMVAFECGELCAYGFDRIL